MPKPAPATPGPDLALLVDSWLLGLRAERKSAQTIKAYGDSVRSFLRWCAANDEDPVLDRRRLARWVDSLLEAGNAAATARIRQLGVRRFSAWLTEEGEFDVDPLLGAKAPKLDRTVIEPLTETQLKALLKACAGPDMRDRRDEAILRLMLESVSTVEVSSSRWVPLPVPYRRSSRFPLNLLKSGSSPMGSSELFEVRSDAAKSARRLRRATAMNGVSLSRSSLCSARYQVQGDAIVLKPMMLTQMACDEPKMEVESMVVDLLEGTVTFAMDGPLLRLTNAGRASRSDQAARSRRAAVPHYWKSLN